MLTDAAYQVVGHASVQQRLPTVGQKVNEIAVTHWTEIASSLRSSQ
jgi:hypothetical protein